MTVNDIETLALVAGVQWASVIEETYQLVNLYIAPQGGGLPSPFLQNNILNYISPLVMPNTTITIFPPTYVPVNIVVELVVLPPFGNSSTQNLVQNALQEYFSLPQTGFGYRVDLGTVYRVILNQPGVDYCIISSMNRGFLATLNATMANGTAYGSLTTTPLPSPVYGGDLLVLTNSNTVYLNSELITGQIYTQLETTAISQSWAQGDVLNVVSASNGAFQVFTVSSGIPAGSTTIPIQASPASATFPPGSSVSDVTVIPNTQTGILVEGTPGMVAAPAGSTSIPVASFTTDNYGTNPNPAFQVGSYVQDLSGAADCVMFENEIPVYGNVTFSPPTTGGLIGS